MMLAHRCFLVFPGSKLVIFSVSCTGISDTRREKIFKESPLCRRTHLQSDWLSVKEFMVAFSNNERVAHCIGEFLLIFFASKVLNK